MVGAKEKWARGRGRGRERGGGGAVPPDSVVSAIACLPCILERVRDDIESSQLGGFPIKI